MGNGTYSFDIRSILHLRQAVGCTDTAAQNGSIGTIIAGTFTLGTSGTEFHDIAGSVQVETRDSGCLGGNQRVEVHCLQQVCFNQDGTGHVALDADHRHLRIGNRAFPQHIYAALPAVCAQVFTEFLTHTLGAQPRDVFFGKVIVQQELDKLILAAADRIAKVIRILPEEHVKDHDGVLEAMQVQAVCHRKFIKVSYHCRIVIIFIRYIRFNMNAHFSSPSFII